MNSYKLTISLLALVLVAIMGLNIIGAVHLNTSNATFSETFEPPPIVTAMQNGYSVSNMSIVNPFTVTINGSTFMIYASYISGTSATIGLNGSIYGLMLNKPVLVRTSPTHKYYVNLTHISPYAKIQTVNLEIYSVYALYQNVNSTYSINTSKPVTINIPNTTATIKLSDASNASVNLSITNVTSIITTSPASYAPILILNVTTTSNSTVSDNLTIHYPCTIPSGALSAFELGSNGSWNIINKFSVNKPGCFVSFVIPPDPVVGLFENKSYTTTSQPTIPKTTTPQAVAATGPTTTVPQQQQLSTIQWITIAVIVLIILIAVYYLLSLSKKQSNKQQPRQPAKK